MVLGRFSVSRLVQSHAVGGFRFLETVREVVHALRVLLVTPVAESQTFLSTALAAKQLPPGRVFQRLAEHIATPMLLLPRRRPGQVHFLPIAY